MLNIESRVLTLRLPEGAENDLQVVFGILSKALQNIEDLPVIPREIEDILTISTAERHRWLKDGRLQSGYPPAKAALREDGTVARLRS
ncbi:hypothetical protein [Mesorhizobium sp. M0684]|uniref:hypothetical protein n=1 Tax=Mesorhizobium sp. M0684 TaxID=2956986 RepID=UPI0033397C3E